MLETMLCVSARIRNAKKACDASRLQAVVSYGVYLGVTLFSLN